MIRQSAENTVLSLLNEKIILSLLTLLKLYTPDQLHAKSDH